MKGFQGGNGLRRKHITVLRFVNDIYTVITAELLSELIQRNPCWIIITEPAFERHVHGKAADHAENKHSRNKEKQNQYQKASP